MTDEKKNKNYHYKQFTFRWTPEIVERLDRLFAIGMYQTKSEIVRRALFYGLQKMELEEINKQDGPRKKK